MTTLRLLMLAVLALLAQTGCKNEYSASTCGPADTLHVLEDARKLVLGIPESELTFLIEIFPSQQPTPLDSMPMVAFKAIRGGPFALDGKVFEELIKDYAPNSLANRGLDSIFPFTISVLADWLRPEGNRGAILTFQFDSKKRRFENRIGDAIDTLPVLLQEIVTYEVKLRVPSPGSQLHFIYLPGTHFYAALDSAGGGMIRLPRGVYDGRLLSFSSILVKLAPVFSLSDSIHTDSAQILDPAGILDSAAFNINTKALFRRYDRPTTIPNQGA